MIVKNYNSKLYLFEKKTGMTGIFSDKELDILLEYSNTGVKTPFIDRLYNLGILIPGSDYKSIGKRSDKNISIESLHIDITDSCPLKCPQCYKGKPENSFMDLKNFKSFVDEAVNLNIFQIAIGGGEPLAHPEIEKFVSIVSQTQMAVTITTSGYSLSEEKIHNLIEKGVNHIQISLNSVDENINSISRDGYKYAINAVKLLEKTGLSFGINIVVRKDNINTLSETLDFAESCSADNVNLLRYKPSGFEEYKNISPDLIDLKSVTEIFINKRGIKIKLDSAFSNLLLYMNNGNISTGRVGCAAGKKFIAITSKGFFKTCSHQSILEKADSIEDYLKRISFKEDIFHRHSICRSCIHKKICRSCRAITKNDNFEIVETDCIGFTKYETKE